LADTEVSTLARRDTLIVMGGANDISKHEAQIGIWLSGKCINSWQNTNTVTVTGRRRHCLQETSCVNGETEVLSRKLHQLVWTADNMKIT